MGVAALQSRSCPGRSTRQSRRNCAHVRRQLAAYFEGTSTSFELVLAPHGTPFQRDVWRALARIPYGTTTTYSAVARMLGRPDASRAVGAANARNPLSIVVPCHRVVGQSGALTGYAGGVANKRALLELEARARPALPTGRSTAPGSAPRAV